MDMIDNDERLLQQFFSEAANQKIEDNGFTERVMQQLASANVQRSTFNVHRFSKLWTIFCISVSMARSISSVNPVGASKS